MTSTLSADQGTGQITLWWFLTFEGTRISSQYKPRHNSALMCARVLSQHSVKASPNYDPKSGEFSQGHVAITQ